MTAMPLFGNVLRTVGLYSIMCVGLKLVGYDKLLEFFLHLMDTLESVLRLMNIRVIANFR